MGSHGSDSFPTIPLLSDEKTFPPPNDSSKADPQDGVAPANSFFKTCFHGINAISGIGIVSIPYAVASGGWLSLSFLFLIAIACYYTGIMVQRCMDMDSNIRTFPDIGQCAFGDKGRLLVSIAMNSELYLVVAGYLILEGDNINNLIPNIHIDFGGGFTIGGATLSTILAALFILPTVWLQDLSLLSFVSATGALASTVFLLSLLWNATLDGTGFHGKGTVFRWSGIPNAVGLYAFCYSAHPVLPTLYTSMRNKNHFSNVLVVCFSLCTLGYAAAAILGYLMFGQDVQSQVTLDLPAGKLSSKVAIYTTLVNPIAKYALMLTPTINAAKSMVPSHYNERLTHFVVSTSMLITNLIVAVAIPLYGYLMALAGSLLCVSTSILVPSVCYLKISGAYRRFGSDMIISYLIIVMGVAIAVVGTYASLLDIIRHYL